LSAAGVVLNQRSLKLYEGRDPKPAGAFSVPGLILSPPLMNGISATQPRLGETMKHLALVGLCLFWSMSLSGIGHAQGSSPGNAIPIILPVSQP
jgi:hypothetical protein